MENYRILSVYINVIIPLFTWMVSLIMNLINRIHYSYEKGEYEINLL